MGRGQSPPLPGLASTAPGVLNPRATQGLRRFAISVIVGAAVTAIPYTWILTTDWNGGPSLFRTLIPSGYTENFYDLQARAIMSGRLNVPTGQLGIESWIHNGHAYTYFGLFPSLLRIPVFVVTHSLDGRLTTLSILLSWLLTALFTALLVWRVRILLRGEVVLGWTEAIACAVVVASVLGGSVLMFLASAPFVYSEDKAWSVALSIGAFFALLGVMERPNWSRMAMCLAMITCTSLTRVTEALACIVAASLVALWFGVGRWTADQRKWWLPMVGVAAVGGLLACLVNWLKFGMLFGLPLHDYTAFHYLHEEAINGGKYFAISYFPSDALAYLNPFGVKVSAAFPFITLPSGPPTAVGGVHFDNRSRTAGLTASMPLLAGLSVIGMLAVFRRHRGRWETSIRLLIGSAVLGTGAVLFYGWIADRYLADFMPFIVIAGATGLVVTWRQLVTRTRNLRVIICLLITGLGGFGFVANFGIAIAPSQFWTPTQDVAFLHFQERLHNATGIPLELKIYKGDVLPRWAPAGSIFIAGDCEGLYLSNGEDFSFVPSQYAEHGTWMLAEAGEGMNYAMSVTVGTPTVDSIRGIPIAVIGHSVLLMHSTPGGAGRVSLWFSLLDPRFPVTGAVLSVASGTVQDLRLFTDRFAGVVTVSVGGDLTLDSPMSAGGKVEISTPSPGPGNAFEVVDANELAGPMALCHQLATNR